MAAATSNGTIALEFHGALADRFSDLGRRRGTRTIVDLPLGATTSVQALLAHLVESNSRYATLFDLEHQRLPEHVEVVLNDRVIELQGGLQASLKSGDVLTFLPAHAGG